MCVCLIICIMTSDNDGAQPEVMCDSGRRVPRAKIKRILRKEANYGCARCGNPLVEYHHIIPYEEVEHSDPEHMIALCGSCHRRADSGAIKRSRLYQLKEDPHISDIVSNDFCFRPQNPQVRFGGLTASLTDHTEVILLRIEQENMFIAHFDNDIIEISAKLRDEHGELIAEIDRNSWWAKSNDVWDMTSKPKELKIWNKPQDIGLQIRYDRELDMIVGRGIFYYNSDLYDSNMVKVFEDKTKLPGGNTIAGSSGNAHCILKIDNGNDPMPSVFGFGSMF